MAVLTESSVELDYCVSCHNVWFDADEIDQYCAENHIRFSLPKVAENSSTHKCPSCDGQLMSSRNDGITVEQCSSCSGVLVSSQTLDAILPSGEPNNAASTIENSVSLVECVGYIANLLDSL